MSHMWSTEFYIQDNWRVDPRLTLDYGLRFYHWGPAGTRACARPPSTQSMWDAQQAPYLYVPALNAQGSAWPRTRSRALLRQRPCSSASSSPTPATSSMASALAARPPASRAASRSTRSWRWRPGSASPTTCSETATPRFAAASASAISRVSTGMHLDMGANPPARYTPVAYYGNIDTLAQSGGLRQGVDVAVICHRRESGRRIGAHIQVLAGGGPAESEADAPANSRVAVPKHVVGEADPGCRHHPREGLDASWDAGGDTANADAIDDVPRVGDEFADEHFRSLKSPRQGVLGHALPLGVERRHVQRGSLLGSHMDW